MNLIEKATVIEYHRHRSEKFPRGNVESLGWRSEESQRRRFEVLGGIGELNGSSVLDIGCGHGDFKGFLDRLASGFTYVGVDNVPEFIGVAQERYGRLANTHFFNADFSTATFPEVDFVVASGALSYRSAVPDFQLAMIEKMFRVARKSLAFNMLRADRFPPHPLLIGHDPEKVLAYCMSLTTHVRMIKDYLPDDFTIFVNRT
ncbi:MAG: class I SAM-dependent methyltransferase [Rhodocyclaceae bacterium]|nr:class I SAM-dependent methyltransferase [Rhodocyclaceae bacterium]